LIGLPLDEMRDRFQISLLKQSATEIRLKFIPRTAQDLSVYSEAQLILFPETYEPRAMRFVSPAGESEDVYVLSNVKINGVPDEPFRDLGRLDLKGYRRKIASER
jgi:hypothetical protein